MNKVFLQKSLLGDLGKYCIYDNQKMLIKTKYFGPLILLPGIYYVNKGLKD